MVKFKKRKKTLEQNVSAIVTQPEEGRLAPVIDAFIDNYLTELGPDDPDVTLYGVMVTTCPPIKAAVKTIILIALSYLGDYVHSDAVIEQWMRQNFERMNGSLRLSVVQLLSAIYMGYSASEIALRVQGIDWVLDSLLILPPERWHFRGRLGDIEDVFYRSGLGDIAIAYDRVLHLVHNPEFAFGNPYGVSDLKAARAAYQAWLVLVAELLVAGKRQATPLLVGYYDPTVPEVPLLDELGQPVYNPDGSQVMVSAAKQIADALSQVENKTALVTSLRHKVDAIARSEGYQIYFEGLRYLHKLMYLALCFPETALEVNAGSGGDSNLAKQQLGLLRGNYVSLMDQVKDQLIDQLVRPLIILNFGVQDNYGQFETPQGGDEDRLALVESLLNTAASGVLSPNDERLVKRIEQALGLVGAP